RSAVAQTGELGAASSCRTRPVTPADDQVIHHPRIETDPSWYFRISATRIAGMIQIQRIRSKGTAITRPRPSRCRILDGNMILIGMEPRGARDGANGMRGGAPPGGPRCLL